MTTASNGAGWLTASDLVTQIAALFPTRDHHLAQGIGCRLAFRGRRDDSSDTTRWRASMAAAAQLLGNIALLLNAVSGAIGWCHQAGSSSALRTGFLVGLHETIRRVGLIAFSAVELARRGSLPRPATLPPWLALIYQAVFSTFIAHVLWNTVPEPKGRLGDCGIPVHHAGDDRRS